MFRKNPIDSYNAVRNEIVKYSNNLGEKNELIALSKSDLVSNEKKELAEVLEKKIGKKPFVFSSVANNGIEDLVTALFELCLDNNDQ